MPGNDAIRPTGEYRQTCATLEHRFSMAGGLRATQAFTGKTRQSLPATSIEVARFFGRRKFAGTDHSRLLRQV